MIEEAILILTAAPGAADCAAAVAKQLNCAVDLVDNRRAALNALRRREYALLLLDETLVEGDAVQADQIVQEAGVAYPLQLNFAVTGPDRVVREARAAMHRRRRETDRARLSAGRAIEAELNSALTGILLELDLVLSSRRMPPEETARLDHVVELTQNLRKRLSGATSACQTAPPQWRSTATEVALLAT